ncbi:MAG: siderophore-interacting protein [Mesorhizobium sp.]|uniref:siderophore-interacting protein n=1 Tax=Mesorhizobium sp. TaxID=1871066 RepID=UPI001AC54D6B|nr:siderophore-interacting protein [Mesorhizobium sp.]MBN9217235.1 siderophore-interacting protein [Mesorhizobium sp.]
MDQLSAQTRISDAAVRSAIEHLRAEHGEYEMPANTADQWELHLYYGSLSATLDGDAMLVRVAATDETCLSYMKMTVAGHVAQRLGTASGLRWQGDGRDGGTPVFFREITVVSSAPISPHMQRLRFHGDDLGRFAHGGMHMRLLLPPSGRPAAWPVMGADGLIVWPGGDDALVVRAYTIRAIDVEGGWLDVDFVLHPGQDTPAAAFAQNARAGDVIGMIGPGGGEAPKARSVLLVGDDTALPAIARVLEDLPRSARAQALIEVDSPDDRIALPQAANIGVSWLYRQGREAGTAGLLPKALREQSHMALGEDLYVWAGCEFADFREIRKIVRKEWGLPRDRHMVTAYWRRGVQGENGAGEE